MSSPLFDSFNRGFSQNQNGSPYDMFGGPQQFQQALNNFAQNFKAQMNCTPEQKVRELLASGRMSQAQFDQLSALANKLTGRN